MADINVRQGEQINLDILSNKDKINFTIEEKQGVSDYNRLTGKPKINGITVQGEKLGVDYRLQDKMDVLSIQEIEKILYLD